MSKSDNRPIGIFDSGIGGLTVAKAIKEVCPNESIIYFGDTAHFPYGDKANYSIRHYCDVIADFLITQNCKAIVIACNTASALSAKILRKKLKGKTPLFDVIDPVAKFVADNFNEQKVGVIATKGTIGSRYYPKSINVYNQNVKVHSVATPLLAPMIEEGFFNNSISQTIVNEYLSKNNLKGIKGLVLGCTHYPIIENEVLDYYKKNQLNTVIINSAKLVANSVSEFIQQNNMAAKSKINEDVFYVSDYTPSFEKSTAIFFNHKVKLEKLDLWKT